MKAILSCTDNDLYSFFLPITTWSWKQIGVTSVVFVPKIRSAKFEFAMDSCPVGTMFFEIDVAEDRQPTYFQCARLFGGFLSLPKDEILITGDIDMAVFGNEFEKAKSDKITIWGADLVPAGQYPICYVAMSVENWRKVMCIGECQTYMQCLENLLGEIQCDNMRGNYWAKDQETIYNAINQSGLPIEFINRARSEFNKTASRREDRDGWGQGVDIIDAHLPRPGAKHENFHKTITLLEKTYPGQTDWIVTYRNKFVEYES